MACSKRAVLHTHTALSESHMEIRVTGTAPIIKEKVRIKKIKNVLKDLLSLVVRNPYSFWPTFLMLPVHMVVL